MVARTGFSTRKGQVIRKSLYPHIKLTKFEVIMMKI